LPPLGKTLVAILNAEPNRRKVDPTGWLKLPGCRRCRAELQKLAWGEHPMDAPGLSVHHDAMKIKSSNAASTPTSKLPT
jgi:hypothetical protein